MSGDFVTEPRTTTGPTAIVSHDHLGSVLLHVLSPVPHAFDGSVDILLMVEGDEVIGEFLLSVIINESLLAPQTRQLSLGIFGHNSSTYIASHVAILFAVLQDDCFLRMRTRRG